MISNMKWRDYTVNKQINRAILDDIPFFIHCWMVLKERKGQPSLIILNGAHLELVWMRT
jgi:hypothetical protein